MMRLRLSGLFVCVATLSACGGLSKKADLGDAAPTYRERVGSTRLKDLKLGVACPLDSAFEKEDWHKQIEFAKACVQSHNFTRVEAIGDTLATHASQTPWGPYFLSLGASARKDFPRAQWMLDLALKKAPNEGLLHYELARLNWQTNQEAAAVAEMKRASDLNASLFEAHLTLGQLAFERGDLNESRKYLSRAEGVDAHDLNLLLTRADVEVRARDYNAAERYLAQAVAQNPKALKARLALAEIQEQQLKKNAEALSNYKQVKALGVEANADGVVPGNLDQRIQALEKLLAQAGHPNKIDENRRPSAER